MTIYVHKYSGVLPAGDIFNFGWHSDTGISLAASHANAVGWANDFWSSLSGYNTLVVPGTVLNKVTTYQLDPLLPFKTDAVAATDITATGSAPTPSLPQDCAIVVSLRSANPARAGRGRMYLPAVAANSLSADGELDNTAVVTAISALATAWAGSRAGGDNPVVFSRTTGLTQAITQFGIGTVIDRQSRRVNKVSTVRTFNAMP